MVLNLPECLLWPCSCSGKHWQALHQGCSASPVRYAGEVQTQHLPVHQHCQQCSQTAPGWFSSSAQLSRMNNLESLNQICQVSPLLWQASRILGIPPILTEQYPKGLGPTVPELGAEDLKAHAKTSFTMMIEEVQKELEALGNPKQAILCGIEAHACIAVRHKWDSASAPLKREKIFPLTWVFWIEWHSVFVILSIQLFNEAPTLSYFSNVYFICEA